MAGITRVITMTGCSYNNGRDNRVITMTDNTSYNNDRVEL
jgi:hypothetical protein